jgi:hypothetical protein
MPAAKVAAVSLARMLSNLLRTVGFLLSRHCRDSCISAPFLEKRRVSSMHLPCLELGAVHRGSPASARSAPAAFARSEPACFDSPSLSLLLAKLLLEALNMPLLILHLLLIRRIIGCI